MLAKVQLPAPPPSPEPVSAVWKSPKSPNVSNAASSRCSGSSPDADANVNGSLPLAAAASENGPKVSCRVGSGQSAAGGMAAVACLSAGDVHHQTGLRKDRRWRIAYWMARMNPENQKR